MASRRIENNWGSADSFLNAVPYINTSIQPDAVAKLAPRDQKELAKALLTSIHQCFAEQAAYNKELDSRVVDVVMGRMASLLDEVQASFQAIDLDTTKKEIIDAISNNGKIDETARAELVASITELFNSTTSKEQLDELKAWISDNVHSSSDSSSSSSGQATGEQPASDKQTYQNKEVDSLEDEEEGDYKDSTVALNFATLQSFIQTQVDQINENLKNIPGQSGILSAIGTVVGNIIPGITSVVKAIGAKTIAGVAAGISGAGAAIMGVGALVKGAWSGIKKIGSGIKSGFSKIGQGIASPFKKIGSFVSNLNPFKKRDSDRNKKNEDKKQALRDKIFNFIAKIIDKIWKIIEPFIDKAAFFMGIVSKMVIIPIAIIVAKVLLVVAAITLLGIGLYLAYQWIKSKIVAFWNYITSGELWEDIKSGLLAAWEWLKDFGAWIGLKLLDFGKLLLKSLLRSLAFVFIDIPVWIWQKLCDFGVWLWDKLCEFGRWLYDTYIVPYIIEPLTRLIQPIANLWVEKIQPKIQPFIDSLLKLKDMVVGIFKGWDTNKSFWENLKNMAGLIKQGVLDWWNESPFKAFYEQHIEPFVISACELFNKLSDLGGFIKQAILNWWNGDSSLGETLKNIGTTLMNAVSEWWETSVFKQAYDEHIAPLIEKLKNYLGDLIKPIREWYEKSWLKKAIDKVVGIIQKVWDKLNIGKKVKEGWNNLKKGSKAIGGKILGWFGKKPQKTTVNTPDDASTQTIKNIEQTSNVSTTIDNVTQKASISNTTQMSSSSSSIVQQQSSSIAQQQVSQAMKPIQSIENMKQTDLKEAEKSGEEISNEIAAEKKQDRIYKDNMGLMTTQQMDMLREINNNVNKYGKDPAAVPVYVPINRDRNSAMMGDN